MTGHNGKPNGGSAGADNRETLARIARLISVADEHDNADDARRDESDLSPDSACEDTLPLASLREPGASLLLEALPAGLAVCEGTNLIRTNTAFALAFGYRSAEQLQQAGGLKTVFPEDFAKLSKHLGENTGAPEAPVELQARSRSGREFRVPIAIHAIGMEAEDDDKACLLVLHPHSRLLAGPDASAPGTLNDRPPKTKPSKKAGTSGPGKPDAKRKKRKKRGKSKSGAPSHGDRTDFLAKVSHELRTPLNSIIGFAEIMKEEQLGPVGNDRYRGYIRDIHDSGIYALSLVNDLLDISKIEAGEFELNFAAVDLEDVVSESVQSMQPQARRQRVLLRTSFADGLPPVLADRRSIRQIVLNLVSNAVKFTRSGGQVIVSTQRTTSGGIRIRVRDTGIGMSRGEIEVALKPFQQVDTSPRKQGGTGLGLPLTRALVEANRAKFKLRSISDAGTRIDVTFPQDRVADTRD